MGLIVCKLKKAPKNVTNLPGVWGAKPSETFLLSPKGFTNFECSKWNMIKKDVGNHFEIKGRGGNLFSEPG